LKDQLFNQRFEHQRCKSGDMTIPVTFILSYIFVGIMPYMLLTWMLWVCSQIHPLHF